MIQIGVVSTGRPRQARRDRPGRGMGGNYHDRRPRQATVLLAEWRIARRAASPTALLTAPRDLLQLEHRFAILVDAHGARRLRDADRHRAALHGDPGSGG